MKTITWQQALILLVCMAIPVAAFKFLGSPEAAGASMAAGMVLNFLLGRDSDPPAPPASRGPGLKAVGLSALLVLCLPGCATWQRDVKSVLDVAQVACIIANASSSDATVAQVCGVADVLIPDLQKILATQRAALAKAKKDAACK